MEQNSKVIDIHAVSFDSFYEIMDNIIDKHRNCNKFIINSVIYKDKSYQLSKDGYNIMFDVTINYSDEMIRYNIVDVFNIIGHNHDSINVVKKHLISLMNTFVWEDDDYDVVNIRTYDGERKIDTLDRGIAFDIIRKDK